MPDRTELINRYFRLAPSTDIAAYFAQFADDAMAEDEGHEYQGIEAIRAWRDTIPSVTYAVSEIRAQDVEDIAFAEVAGGFPGSPVTLAFHFTFTEDGHIRRLAIRLPAQ